MNSKRTFALVLLLAATSYCGLAWAATPQERAEEFYKSGAESYFRGDILVALSAFQQGYELDPNAMFLYNISLCYSKIENYAEALAQAKMAHRKGLPAEVSDKNLARVAAYQTILLSQEIAASPAVEVSACESGDCAANTGVGKSDSVESAKPTWIGWTGVAVAAVGGGLVVGAVLVDSGLESDIDAYDAALAAGEVTQAQQMKNDIDGQQTLGKVLLISGGVLAATGIGLFIYDLLDSEPVAIVPVMGDQIGAALIRRF